MGSMYCHPNSKYMEPCAKPNKKWHPHESFLPAHRESGFGYKHNNHFGCLNRGSFNRASLKSPVVLPPALFHREPQRESTAGHSDSYSDQTS